MGGLFLFIYRIYQYCRDRNMASFRCLLHGPADREQKVIFLPVLIISKELQGKNLPLTCFVSVLILWTNGYVCREAGWMFPLGHMVTIHSTLCLGREAAPSGTTWRKWGKAWEVSLKSGRYQGEMGPR